MPNLLCHVFAFSTKSVLTCYKFDFSALWQEYSINTNEHISYYVSVRAAATFAYTERCAVVSGCPGWTCDLGHPVFSFVLGVGLAERTCVSAYYMSLS